MRSYFYMTVHKHTLSYLIGANVTNQSQEKIIFHSRWPNIMYSNIMIERHQLGVVFKYSMAHQILIHWNVNLNHIHVKDGLMKSKQNTVLYVLTANNVQLYYLIYVYVVWKPDRIAKTFIYGMYITKCKWENIHNYSTYTCTCTSINWINVHVYTISWIWNV